MLWYSLEASHQGTSNKYHMKKQEKYQCFLAQKKTHTKKHPLSGVMEIFLE